LKKYIPNPVRESLKFKPEVAANKSSTKQSLDWSWPVRNLRVSAPGAQPSISDDNHTLGNYSVEGRATGRGQIIEGNHPRSGNDAYHADEAAKLS
jgi:hypothetical protein